MKKTASEIADTVLRKVAKDPSEEEIERAIGAYSSGGPAGAMAVTQNPAIQEAIRSASGAQVSPLRETATALPSTLLSAAGAGAGAYGGMRLADKINAVKKLRLAGPFPLSKKMKAIGLLARYVLPAIGAGAGAYLPAEHLAIPALERTLKNTQQDELRRRLSALRTDAEE